MKSDDIIFRCKIILSLENIYKIFWKYMNIGSRTSSHDSDYSGDQENGEIKAGNVLCKQFIFGIEICLMYFALPGGWVTQAGGAVTLDQISILSAPGSLKNN